MLRAIELHTDFPFLPSHVDAGDEATGRVANDYLGPRTWQTSIQQQQSRAGFLRRFGAWVYQLQCLSQLDDSTTAGVPPGDCLNVCCPQARCAGQCIEPNHRPAQSRAPTDVVSRTRWCGHRDAADPTQFVIGKSVSVNDNAVGGSLSSDELRGRMGVQPSCTKQRRRGQTSHRRAAIGPKPCRHRPISRSDLYSVGDIYVAVDHLVSAAQGPLRRNTRRDSFSAQEWPVIHASKGKQPLPTPRFRVWS